MQYNGLGGGGSRYGAAYRFVTLGLVTQLPVLLAVILLPGIKLCASFTIVVALCSAVGMRSPMLVIARLEQRTCAGVLRFFILLPP